MAGHDPIPQASASRASPTFQAPSAHRARRLLPRRFSASAAPPFLALLSALLFFVQFCRGADITLSSGSQGCLSKTAPSAPRNLQATGKDGRLLLTWDAPSDGSCVDTYVVTATDPALRYALPVKTVSTSGTRASLDGLSNGQKYNIAVQSYSDATRGGGVATVSSSPSSRCDSSQAPGTPVNLRATAGDQMAEVCWDGVANDACVSEYRVSVVRDDSFGFRSSGDDGAISKGGCANVTGLANDVKYRFSVLPVGPEWGEGTSASVSAYVGASVLQRNGWTCTSLPGCRPDFPGMCADASSSTSSSSSQPSGRTSPLPGLSAFGTSSSGSSSAFARSGSSSSGSGSTAGSRVSSALESAGLPGLPQIALSCDVIARTGQCRNPLLADVDLLNKEVTQWCGQSCACDVGAASNVFQTGSAATRISSGLSSLTQASDLFQSTSNLASLFPLGGVMTGSGSGSGLSSLASPDTSTMVSSLAGLSASSGSGTGFGSGALLNSLAESSSSTRGSGLTGSGSDLMSSGVLGDLGSATSRNAAAMRRNMVLNVVDTGVVGEAMGKATAAVVSSTVNSVMQQMVSAAGR